MTPCFPWQPVILLPVFDGYFSAVEARESEKALVDGSAGEVIVNNSCGLSTTHPIAAYDEGFLPR